MGKTAALIQAFFFNFIYGTYLISYLKFRPSIWWIRWEASIFGKTLFYRHTYHYLWTSVSKTWCCLHEILMDCSLALFIRCLWFFFHLIIIKTTRLFPPWLPLTCFSWFYWRFWAVWIRSIMKRALRILLFIRSNACIGLSLPYWARIVWYLYQSLSNWRVFITVFLDSILRKCGSFGMVGR